MKTHDNTLSLTTTRRRFLCPRCGPRTFDTTFIWFQLQPWYVGSPIKRKKHRRMDASKNNGVNNRHIIYWQCLSIQQRHHRYQTTTASFCQQRRERNEGDNVWCSRDLPMLMVNELNMLTSIIVANRNKHTTTNNGNRQQATGNSTATTGSLSFNT